MQVKLSQLLMAMSQVCDLAEAKELGHAQRVALLALTIRDACGDADPAARAELTVAALLHDLGVSSVSYGLYEQLGANERPLLARYPSIDDGLFGAGGERDTERFIVERHAGLGARLLQSLGYDRAVTDAVTHHHALLATTPEAGAAELAARVLALADLIETATYPLGTAQARQQRAIELLGSVPDERLDPDERVAIARALDALDLWERLLFLDDAEQTFDACFTHTYGVHIPPEGFEAHLRVLAQIIDAQSPYTSGHTLEVTRLARRIGEHLGLDPDALSRLYVASLIHGAGRLAISSSILEKAGGLSEDEFVTLHTYPDLTREALAPLTPLRDLTDEASTHREKLDGSGYPEARIGDEIPLIGRILGVADTFIALISDRPYRAGYSRSRALAIIQSESARLFDGLITDALEAIYRQGL